MKKALSLLLSLLLVLSLAPVAFAAPRTEKLDVYDAELDPVSKSIIFRQEVGDYYQLMDAKGKIVVTAEEGYDDMHFEDGFIVTQKLPVNGREMEGLLATDGTLIIPAQYDFVRILNDRWQVGIVFGPGTEEDHDATVTSDSQESYYNFVQFDFFFDGELAGTFDRSVCGGSFLAYGAYLCCCSEDGEISFYNGKLERSPYEAEYMDEFDWDYDDNGNEIYTHQGSGEIAFQPDCTLKAEDVETAYYYADGKVYDLQGKEIAAYSREFDDVESPSDGYVIVEADGKWGLITLDGQELIPPEYDRIGYGEDHILQFGYIAAEKDGKFGFFDAKGNLTCDFLYPADDAYICGNMAKLKNDDGSFTVITGAAGELPEHYSYVYILSDGCKAFYAELADGTHGLVDEQGKALIPFSADIISIEVSEDGTVALAYQNGAYVIYRF